MRLAGGKSLGIWDLGLCSKSGGKPLGNSSIKMIQTDACLKTINLAST